MLEQVAERIRELRKVRKLTQAAVFEDTGVDVGRIEVGRTNVTITTLTILCDYFEISLAEFFNGIGDKSGGGPKW